jgi:xylan 1,4-beta-xylosidase
MIWNYRDADSSVQSWPVELNINGLADGKVQVSHYRVDKTHSNSFEEWKSMGAPAVPTIEQYKKLEAAGKLSFYDSPQMKNVQGGKLSLAFDLPDQAVSLIKLSW